MNRRRKTCKFCENNRNVITNPERSIRMVFDADEGNITVRRHIDSPILVKIPMDFCPVCGRRVTPFKL